jgi:alkylated DNA repair dioxygenase AlkB
MRLSFLVNYYQEEVAWYGDTTFSYTYSKRTKQALIWTPRLLALKTIVEEKLEKPTILVCLIYITQVRMGWHSDAEKKT